ncbi:unnamed protein product [Trichogramma brassicae]|uniref:Uncharacterized protein n=1 Tax=Trichogramma brassicae TaxID=86971 RepID=A0A6H5IYE5_9HYME|nr:unnamed protein product [Trichogramma brassicae]
MGARATASTQQMTTWKPRFLHVPRETRRTVRSRTLANRNVLAHRSEVFQIIQADINDVSAPLYTLQMTTWKPRFLHV